MENTNVKSNVAMAATKAVTATVAQGFEHAINIRVLGGTDIIKNPFNQHCQPRRGAERQDKDLLDLPQSLVNRFDEVNKKFVSWLAQSADNVTQFVNKPLEALQKAGIELTREEQKHISRNVEAVKEVAVIPPGGVVTKIAAGFQKGKLSTVITTPDPKRNSNKSTGSGSGGCGC